MQDLVAVLSSVAIITLPTAAASQIDASERMAQASEHLHRLVPFGFSGSVVVEEAGELLMAEGFGLADRDAGREMAPDTPMPIGSLSKQFTAATILSLAQDGTLSVHDRVDRWLPSAPDPLAQATVRDLLRHRSGLPYHSNRNFAEAIDRPAVVDEMLHLPLDFEPGTGSGYSNPGYTLLAAIVEAATGQNFEEAMEERVVRPAGLTATGSVFDDDRWVTSARGYQDDVDQGPASSYAAMGKALGAASVVSSATDLMRWLTALRSGRVLEAPWVDSLFTRAAGPDAGSFGMGWMVAQTERGTPARFHRGDLGPFNAIATMYPEEGRTVVLLSNARLAGQGTRDPAALALGRILAGAPPELPPRVTAALPPIDSAAFGNDEAGGLLRRTAEGYSLALNGESRRLFDAVPAADSARARTRVDTRTVMAALARGDYEVLSRFAHPAMSWQGLARREQADAMEPVAGREPVVEVRLPVATGPRSWRTVAEVTSGGRTWARAFVWDGGGLLDVRSVDAEEADFSVRPEADVPGIGLVSYDLFSGRTVRLRAEGSDAVIEGLAGEHWRGPITAVYQTPTPPAACGDTAYRGFDFWLGEWEVTRNDGTGTVLGVNSIRPAQGGCLLVESWEGRAGVGTSLNYYSPATAQWHQQWVSPGNAITLQGGVDARGAMRMEGSLHDARSRRTMPFRGSWIPQPDGSVRQLFEIVTGDDDVWSVWFDGIYRRAG